MATYTFNTVNNSGVITGSYSLSYNNTVAEGGMVTVVVTRTFGSGGDNIRWKAVAGTATAADFPGGVLPDNQFNINATGGTHTFQVPVGTDLLIESTETFGIAFADVTPATDLGSITINVTDVAPANTAPSAVNFTGVVATTAENGDLVKVADIAVSDDGQGTNVLSLSGADAGSFTIVGNALYFNGHANYESGKTTYSVNVDVNDLAVGVSTPDATKTFTLGITNVNEAPTLDPLSATSFNEGQPGSIDLASPSGSDPDGDALTYSLVGAPSIFAISGGKLVYTGAGEDYETGTKTWTLTVQASDGALLSNTQTIVVSLNDVNEAPDAGASVSVDVAEDTAPGVLTSVSASDPDGSAPFNTLSYSITNGNDDGLFSIDATGKVSLAAGKSLNYEAATTHTLTVTVTDGGGLSDTTTVTINVTDVNEAPEAGEPVSVSVAENAASGVLGAISASDPDKNSPFKDLSYSITNGNNDGLFSIDAAGNVSLAVGKSLNYEAATTHTLTVTVTDGGGLSDTTTFTVNVQDVNEGPSAGDDVVANVLESASGVLTKVTGIDPDSSAPFNTLTYAITNGNAAGLFAINTATGEISVAAGKTLDYETAASHVLTVSVSDGGSPSLSDTALVTINVGNVAEKPFTNGSDTVNFNTYTVFGKFDPGAQYSALDGNDVVYLANLATKIDWDYNQTFDAGAGNDKVFGGDGADIVSGGAGNDLLLGGAGDDRLVGAAGDDILVGGAGVDKLTGAAGKDAFVFNKASDIGTLAGPHDVITDFAQKEDIIDLSGLYKDHASSGISNSQTVVAWGVSWYSANGKTYIIGDVDGNTGIDFAIELSGNYKITKSDVILTSGDAVGLLGYSAADLTLAHAG